MIGRKSLGSFASGLLGIKVVRPLAQLCGTSLRSSMLLYAQPSQSRLRALTSSHLLPSGPGAVEGFVLLIALLISSSVIGPVTYRVGLVADGECDSCRELRPKRPA